MNNQTWNKNKIIAIQKINIIPHSIYQKKREEFYRFFAIFVCCIYSNFSQLVPVPVTVSTPNFEAEFLNISSIEIRS